MVNVADIVSKLRGKTLKAVDAHPVVLDCGAPRPDIPWIVR